MSANKKQRSVLDEFLKIKHVDGVYIKGRTKGFKYLHNVTTKALAEGVEFKMGNIDFSRFTEDDICDYMDYYHCYIKPVEQDCIYLLNRVNCDIRQFKMINRFRGMS